MCSHYEGVRDAQVLRKVFQVEPPANTGKSDLWPGYPGLLIRRPREKDSGDDAVPDREVGISDQRDRWFRYRDRGFRPIVTDSVVGSS
jgi:hypothetical protein